MSTNFAMQDLSEYVTKIGAANVRNMRAVLWPYTVSTSAAFKIQLTATVNGTPVPFRELTGDETGNEGCNPNKANSCIGNYGNFTGDRRNHPPEIYFYPLRSGPAFYPRETGYDLPSGDVFQRLTMNKRTARAVAFSNSIMDPDIDPVCLRNYPLYKTLGEMESKQDCLFDRSDIRPDQKYKGPPSYLIEFTIGENNQFIGRNRVLEFDAHPMDILELHYSLAGAEQTIQGNTADPSDTVIGKFSVFETPSGRYLIPRSPSQILSNAEVNSQEFACPPAPIANQPLPPSCRPWTRLAWTEVLLGAQYRTYSDGQMTPQNQFSIKRRRELFRLQPEIEVPADQLHLEYAVKENGKPASLPRVEDQKKYPQFRAFYSRDPNVSKTGGDWAFVGGRAVGGVLSPLKAFVDLRYSPDLIPHPTDYAKARDQVQGAENGCGKKSSPDFSGCQGSLGSVGTHVLNLDGIDFFALSHRFVGPVFWPTLDKLLSSGDASAPETGVCSAERPSRTASCWMGLDDTVSLESAIRADAPPAETPVLHSVSALLGIERPPIANFVFEFNSYKSLACLDPNAPHRSCPPCPDPNAPTQPCPKDSANPPSPAAGEVKPFFPNRPMPAADQLPVYPPILTSESESISFNEGVSPANASQISTNRQTTRQFMDMQGGGFPNIISDGSVELNSPIGLTRKDWWRYYRTADDAASLNAELQADGYLQHSSSTDVGLEVGSSPSTAALAKPRGSRTSTSGSPDGNVQPGFSADLEHGQDDFFTEYVDLNGDGIPDVLAAGKVGDPLSVNFNLGNALRSGSGFPLTVSGAPVSGTYFNNSNSVGLGIRLGFSFEADSLALGTGLSGRENGSQAAFADLLGHGRSDVVLPGSEPGTLVSFPNLGNGFGPARIHKLDGLALRQIPSAGLEGTRLSETAIVDATNIFTGGVSIPYFKVVFTPSVKWAQNQTRELIAIRDVNGDGAPDVITVSGDFYPLAADGAFNLDPDTLKTRIYYNPEAKYHFLSGIKNPSGSELVLRQGLVGNSGVGPDNNGGASEIGRAVWALTGVARYDGYSPSSQAGQTPHGQNVHLKTYDYSGSYFNRAERQFYGFSDRVSRDYGCTATAPDAADCLTVVRGEGELDLGNYRPLQTVRQTFSNWDYLNSGPGADPYRHGE